jgi:SET domain-containing protein
MDRHTKLRVKPSTSELSFKLKPSSIHGIGVFARHAIHKGTRLRLFRERYRYLRPTRPYRSLISRFGVPTGGGYFTCPWDFCRMSVGWYLNHSDIPNARHRNFVYYAASYIRSGEEITIDYRTLLPKRPK